MAMTGEGSTSKKAGPTKGQRTRARILTSARSLFIEYGIDAVTIRDIAALAGVNHALVHRYFGTKDELVAAVLEREIDTTGAILRERTAGVTDPLDWLAAILPYSLEEGGAFFDLVAQIQRAGIAPVSIVPPDPVRPFADFAGALGMAQVEAGIAGQAPDPAITALVISATVWGLANDGPFLMAGVGLDPVDLDLRRGEILAELVRVAASTLQSPRVAPAPGNEGGS